MPFAAMTRPSLSVGLLQANLQRAGIECESVYANLLLGDMLGPSAYRRFSSEAAIAVLAGEWVFSQSLFGERLSTWSSYCREVLDDPTWGTSPERQPEILRLREVTPAFLSRAFDARNWGSYDLVGFTSTFEQTMPSLCLARLIRERHPSTLLALGGANLEAGMGIPYFDHFDFLDFVSTGEADRSLVELCRGIDAFKRGRSAVVPVPHGFLFRPGGPFQRAPGPLPAVDLEGSPTPDYDDFFRAADADGAPAAGEASRHWLPIEASRGCWWGEKVHCTFCGLNGDTMRFRAKSARRVADEANELVARYRPTGLQFADNILATEYFESLLPRWAEQGDALAKFFEIKSNLTRDQVELLRRSGVRTVQAGIESLDDHTLRVMGKGVSAAQNVALLRWCLELGVVPMWNLIYGFPEEPLDSYGATLGILRRLVHLPPPDVAAPIRMDRFSPNFVRWREHGFTSVEPMPAYRHVFPFDPQALERAAYYFRYDHPQFRDAMRLGAELGRFIGDWQARHHRGDAGALRIDWRDDGFVATDTRFTSPKGAWLLGRHEVDLLMACDRPVSRATALGRAGEVPDSAGVDLEAAFSTLLEQGLVLRAGHRYVTLACLADAVRERSAVAMVKERAHAWPVMLTSRPQP